MTGRAVYQQGTLISPNVNGLLTEVSVIDPLWVVFSVSDNELLQGKGESQKKQLILPSAQEYTVRLQLADGSFFPHIGKLNFTAPTLDPDTGALVVRATFANPEGLVLPGQFVKAYVYGAYRPDAIIVPQEAVFQGKDGMFVYVVSKEGVASLRVVEPGEWYKNYWIIKKGLQPGDVVIVEGTNKVFDGASVKVTAISVPETPNLQQEMNP
jgi:membrane fusion protein (multidrug efflux system)